MYLSYGRVLCPPIAGDIQARLIIWGSSILPKLNSIVDVTCFQGYHVDKYQSVLYLGNKILSLFEKQETKRNPTFRLSRLSPYMNAGMPVCAGYIL